MTTTDLIIIGSGPGGYKTAEYAAHHGLQVVIFERAEAGGTCLNCGCIPTKTLARNAEVLEDLQKADTFGLTDLHFQLDFQQVMERKQHVVEQLRNGVETLMSRPGITLVRAEARLKDAHTVVANGEEYSAKDIIIATGSVPKMLPIPIDRPEADILTSTQLLAIDHVPARLCIVGAGVIGMEFASIFHAFGSEVTVVEYLDECLPMVQPDFAKRLRTQLKRHGITFHMGAAVKAVTAEGVVFERKGKELVVAADKILMATGRAPQTTGLGLEAAGIASDGRGIRVNEHYETCVPHVYAIGDVNGLVQLAHAATAQGQHVVNCILGRPDDIRMDIVPAAVFTSPELGFVGRQTATDGQRSAKVYYRANGRALAMDETDGLLELTCDAEGLLTGCTVLGPHAADIAQEVAVLMCRHTTAAQLCDMIHNHPTVNELLVDAAGILAG